MFNRLRPSYRGDIAIITILVKNAKGQFGYSICRTKAHGGSNRRMPGPPIQGSGYEIRVDDERPGMAAPEGML